MIVIEILLGLAALAAAAGYVATALSSMGEEMAKPILLAAVILALGFLGLLLK